MKKAAWTLALLGACFGFLIPAYFFLARCSIQFTDFSFLKLIFAPMALHLLFQTLELVSATLVILVGVALGLAFTLHFGLKRKPALLRICEFALSIFWVLPSLFFVMLTWKLLRGVGLESWLYSLRAVQVAWVMGFAPYMALGLLKIMADFDPRESEAARTLGANTRIIAQTLYVPRLLPALVSLSLQALWLMLTSFSLVVILGGGSPHDTLETAIYQSVRFYESHMDRAFALAFWQALLMGVLYFTKQKFEQYAFAGQGSQGSEWGCQAPPLAFQKSTKEFSVFSALVFFGSIAFLMTTPLSEIWKPWLQSLLLGSGVTALTLFCAGALYFSWRSLAEGGALISPLILALMWWEAYGLYQSPWLLCIGVQVILFMPWVSRTLFPLLDRVRNKELEAAQTLGANRVQAWLTVEWPRVRAEVKTLAAWIMGFSMAEVSSVILFSKGEFEPLSVWSQNQISRFRFEEGFDGIKLMVFTSFLILLFFTFFKTRRT